MAGCFLPCFTQRFLIANPVSKKIQYKAQGFHFLLFTRFPAIGKRRGRVVTNSGQELITGKVLSLHLKKVKEDVDAVLSLCSLL